MNKDLIRKAQKLYEKIKKLRRSTLIIKKRLAHHEARLKIIEETEIFLENILNSEISISKDSLQAICEIKEDLETNLSISKRKSSRHNSRKKSTNPIPLIIHSPNGLIIQVGRNHRQNEWISFKKSRAGDIWFHAQECSGSHVVLKSSCGFAEMEDLQMAADLAAFFSRAKGNKRVSVISVPTNQLQRLPGGTPGTVRHKDGKIVWGEPLRAMKNIQSN